MDDHKTMRNIDLSDFQVATSETARDINRRIVLNLIRRRQPISRADLARHSGLQRSTVSAITDQLIAERWVMEGAMGQLPRGRKPRFLQLNATRTGIIGINVRPITTTIALAGLDTRFIAQESMPTLKKSTAFVEELIRRVKNLMETHPEISYEGIGVSVPGRVDLNSQEMVFAPNLNWGRMNLKTPLEKATGLPVELENAANACALAELWSGQHAEGTRNLVAVTVSEGIGVGMILNGQLVRGSQGMAGEFGHVSVSEQGVQCRCGNLGCWEIMASSSAAIRYYTQATGSTTSPRSHGLNPTFENILRLAQQGDQKAALALDKMAHYLGAGTAMLVTGLAPDAIMFVGEFTQAWSRMGPIIQQVLKQRSQTRAATRILPADETAQPRLRGAIALVLQKHFGAPSIA